MDIIGGAGLRMYSSILIPIEPLSNTEMTSWISLDEVEAPLGGRIHDPA